MFDFFLFLGGGGKTTIHLGPGPASELPNIQVGDQNYMVIGGSTRGSNRSNKVKKKPKQKIEGLSISQYYQMQINICSKICIVILIYWLNLDFFSGWSRNLRTMGRGIIFEVWRLFWCPFTHTLCVVVRVENEVHIGIKHCMLFTLNFMRVIESKF